MYVCLILQRMYYLYFSCIKSRQYILYKFNRNILEKNSDTHFPFCFVIFFQVLFKNIFNLLRFRPSLKNVCLELPHGVSRARREEGNFLIIFQIWSLTYQKLVTNKNLHIIYYYFFFTNKILSVGGISMRREAIPDKQ